MDTFLFKGDQHYPLATLPWNDSAKNSQKKLVDEVVRSRVVVVKAKSNEPRLTMICNLISNFSFFFQGNSCCRAV